MLAEIAYADLRKRLDEYEEWLRARKYRSYHPDELPAELDVPTNEERSAVEVYEFCRDKPDKYFCYIHEGRREATTCIGDKLGSVQFGRPFRDNFGGERVPVTVVGINGIRYHGTYFRSAGDYARLKAYTRQAA